jgi:hypothetical protein
MCYFILLFCILTDSYQWLREHFGDWEMINSPRDLTNMVDLVGWTVGDYIDYCTQYATHGEEAFLFVCFVYLFVNVHYLWFCM